MEREFFCTNQLYTPGPTPVSLAAKFAPLMHDIYHRSDEFYELFLSCRKMLAPFFGTKHLPIILTSSGSGAMEAAMVNLTEENEDVLVVKVGKFGERFEKIAKTYRCNLHLIEKSAGMACEPEDLTATLKKNPKIRAVFFQANETSTGVFNPVSDMVKAIQKASPEILIVVDGVSAIGAHQIEMDKLGIDCLISGSQKGFGVPPGLAFIAISERASKIKTSRPKFYFDLAREEKGQLEGRTAWTPAISVVQSLNVSLQEMTRIGPQNLAKHHERLTEVVRQSTKAMGLEPFVIKHYSHALTSVHVPQKIDGQKILKIAKAKYGAIISGGQDELKGKIIRFSHLGFVSVLHTIQGLAALEMSLAEAGYAENLGEGVKLATQLLARSSAN